MEDEYTWLAGLAENEENLPTHDCVFHQEEELPHDDDYTNGPIDGLDGPVDGLLTSEYDGDGDGGDDEVCANSMSASMISDSSFEIAVIDMPTTDSSFQPEQCSGEDYDKIPGEQSGSLHIGGRVYSVTASLIGSIQNYLLDGVNLAVQTTKSVVTSKAKSLISSARKGAKSAASKNAKLADMWSMNTISSCIIESCYFAVDRTRTYTKWYTASLTSDDPEVAHHRTIRNTRSIKNIITPDPHSCLTLDTLTVKRRARFATLSWTHRQMLHCTKDTVEGRTQAPKSTPASRTPFPPSDSRVFLARENPEDQHSRIVMDRYSALDALIAAFEAGDVEASVILTDLVSPPHFAEDSVCSECQKEFSVSLFRHHCRHCGFSFCREHSSFSRPIFKYGYTDPVRVCQNCQGVIDAEARLERIQWRLLRIRDYLRGELIPFFSHNVDTGVDKAIRVVDGTLYVVKKALLQNYPAVLVVETVEILRRYGMSGLAGVLMRQDFVEAVETLLKISGMDKHYPISLHELTACIYYKLAIDRGLRGCNPEGEYLQHCGSEIVGEPQDGDSGLEGCDAISNFELNEIIRYASMALMLAYEEDPTECQRMAAMQGYTALCIREVSKPEEPAFSLYATTLDNSSGSDHINTMEKEVVLAIRGTSSVHDVVTDIRAAPAMFPPTPEEIMHMIYGSNNSESPINEGCDEYENGTCIPSQIESTQEWEWLPTQSTRTYSCGGICRSAMYVISEVGASLSTLAEQGYRVRIVGHSLGGAVAALVTYMLKSIDMENIHCYGYGVPSFIDDLTADSMSDFVTSVVLHDDFIARVTPASIRLLIKEIQVFKSEIFTFLQQDWSDAISRAAGLWTPRVRGGDTRAFMKQKETQSSPPKQTKKMERDNLETPEVSTDSINGGDCVVVHEHEVIQLWLPGRIVHIFSRRGVYEASVVPRTFPDLRKIVVQGNIFRDHGSQSIFEALQEVRACRRAPCRPPEWTPYNGVSNCICCNDSFTWHSTFRGEAQQYRERYNCRSCGGLVCGPCSNNRQPVMRLGLMAPSRICDRCFYSGVYAESYNPPSRNSS